MITGYSLEVFDESDRDERRDETKGKIGFGLGKNENAPQEAITEIIWRVIQLMWSSMKPHRLRKIELRWMSLALRMEFGSFQSFMVSTLLTPITCKTDRNNPQNLLRYYDTPCNKLLWEFEQWLLITSCSAVMISSSIMSKRVMHFIWQIPSHLPNQSTRTFESTFASMPKSEMNIDATLHFPQLWEWIINTLPAISLMISPHATWHLSFWLECTQFSYYLSYAPSTRTSSSSVLCAEWHAKQCP